MDCSHLRLREKVYEGGTSSITFRSDSLKSNMCVDIGLYILNFNIFSPLFVLKHHHCLR